ncbi:hypothetical protein [Yersinia phage fHe-Yen9-04]|uniref:peptidyl-tRNA hydrolase n=2 Tax=Eneladusvirus Yen904 TaxID=2560849 RepID=A0A2C9CXW2_9CAUD|nr:hypothetical protein FDJ41_gp509 [Yersinia phage fHe-Yen9-04]SOK58671.1 hypothetical protein [Yersinia phage fHe-Yen9-04]SOK59206.1 hypothetical protein [Yersinia phage fHe-Yen9-03]VUE36440.1 hypothetical protein [Yersinia phage fHe-Yen9-04]
MEKPVLKYKCYILLREDLEMPQGKFAVQVGHGIDQAWSKYLEYKNSSNTNDIIAVSNFEDWVSEGRRKIVLRLKDEDHMNKIKEKIQSNSTEPYFVHDIFDYGFNFFDGLTQTGLIIYPTQCEISAVKRLRCW